MATELPTANGAAASDGENSFAVKAGLARMLKGGVIMDVVNAEQVATPPLPYSTHESKPNPSTRNACAFQTKSLTRLPGTHSRRSRRRRRHGPRARAGRHPRPGRRRAHV